MSLVEFRRHKVGNHPTGLLLKGEELGVLSDTPAVCTSATTSLRCCTVAAQSPRSIPGASFSPIHFACKLRTFASGPAWTRTRDLFLIREAL